ncbi:hypothetical protein GCM10027589_20250 [Actinocorallia lasiicapitis]
MFPPPRGVLSFLSFLPDGSSARDSVGDRRRPRVGPAHPRRVTMCYFTNTLGRIRAPWDGGEEDGDD